MLPECTGVLSGTTRGLCLLEEATVIRDTEMIEAKAESLLSELFGSNLNRMPLPVDIAALIEFKGIEVRTVEFKNPDISGAFQRTPPTIFLSASDSYDRTSFTAAHELGHYILHEDSNLEMLLRRDVGSFGGPLPEREQEANWFAAALLMPRAPVKKLWRVLADSEEMARIFRVPRSTMYYRLLSLGLLAR